jgi:hypothetical protein
MYCGVRNLGRGFFFGVRSEIFHSARDAGGGNRKNGHTRLYHRWERVFLSVEGILNHEDPLLN